MSAEVETAAALADAAATKIEVASGTFARRLISAAAIADAALTPELMLQARRAVQALSPGTAWPASIAAAATIDAFARLTASASVLRRSARMAVQLGSVPLADKVARTALSMLNHVGRISDAFAAIERATAPGAGLSRLGDFEISDFMRAGAGVLVLLAPGTAGSSLIPAAVTFGLASIIDEIDGTGSEAAELARAACAEQQRTTGAPCTPDEWAAFYTQNRTAEREDGFDRTVRSALEELLSNVGSAVFWLLLLGGVGTALYFAWPAIAAKGAEGARGAMKGLPSSSSMCGCDS